MKAADLPVEALKLHPITTESLRRRGLCTVGQVAACTASDLHKTVSSEGVQKIRAALAERGLALVSRGRGRKPTPNKSAAPAAPPAAPAIPPLPRLGRVTVRVKAPPPRTWSWPAQPPLATVRAAAGAARAWLAAALIRAGERLA